MDSHTAISFDQISKMYRLGLVGTGTLGQDLNRWWKMNILHREDPYLKIGETNDRSTKGTSDFVYALKNITFDVEQGDVVGIIGKNGSGKSTLLKLLSRITAPTTGSIKARGRIASLLEVGTGFHPELTGRENIYMNGSIMGMTRKEIDRKLDEIVDFAGVERYLDTPTKRYSSGMTVRLGFAVAAFLEPEILVVDEVLAVGDAEFQKKAIGKMQDVSAGEGRTVLFVSHNMASVRTLCRNGIILKNGMIDYVGTADDCVDYYMENNIMELVGYAKIAMKAHRTNKNQTVSLQYEFEYLEARLLNDPTAMATDEPLRLELTIRRNRTGLDKCQCGVMINDAGDVRVGTFYSQPITVPQGHDTFKATITLAHHNLANGKYWLDFKIFRAVDMTFVRNYDFINHVLSFEVKYCNAATKTINLIWSSHLGSSCYWDGEVAVKGC